MDEPRPREPSSGGGVVLGRFAPPPALFGFLLLLALVFVASYAAGAAAGSVAPGIRGTSTDPGVTGVVDDGGAPEHVHGGGDEDGGSGP